MLERMIFCAGAAGIVHRDVTEAGACGDWHEHRGQDVTPTGMQHAGPGALRGRAHERKANGHCRRK